MCSCASIAEQKADGTASQTAASATDNVTSAGQQTQPASVGPHTGVGTQPGVGAHPGVGAQPGVGPHPGLSDAAFKRAVGETPPSPDDLEKVLSTVTDTVSTHSFSVDQSLIAV